VKAWRITGVLLITAIAAVVVYAWHEARRGFSARQEPSAIETILAKTARNMALPSEYQKLRNPFPMSPENLRAGMEHFADHCAICHANDGSGDTPFGKNLYPKPPDMRTAETQHKSDGELYYTIQNGVRLSGMPAFGEAHGTADADTWKLVLFIRHLPKLTNDQLKEMEVLNPKTDEERREESEEQNFLQGKNPQSISKEFHHH
jgi:mono/diheme cytochrome c family protein